jgi:hypothetical protein
VTVIVKLKVPATVGVPEMTPVDEFKLVLVGNAPDVTANVYPGVPFCALMVSE